MTDANSAPRNSWSLRLALIGLAGLGSALVGNGCSAVLSFNQCTTDADCGSFEGDWLCENSICVPDGTASGDGDGDGTTGDGDGDGDSGDGDGDGDSGDGDGDTSGGACTTNQECIDAHNDNWLCGPTDECLNGATSECTEVRYPDDEVENVIWIGSIMPTSPPFDTLVKPIENATLLAIEDFNKEANLPNNAKLGWIACDSLGSADVAQTAAQHLVDVGVPAIVGPIFSEAVIQAAEAVTIPNDVYMISPTGSNKAITNLADKPSPDANGLVWRLTTSDVYQANALADRMNKVASQNSTVILYKSDAYGTDLATDAYGALDGPLANVTATYPYTVYPDMDDLLAEIGTVLGQVIANDAPETVVIVGTSEAAAIILTYLQIAGQIDPGLIPQKFIMSHGGVPAMIDTINNSPPESQQFLYSIMEGEAPIIFDPDNFAAFNIRYKVRFMDQDAITTSSLSYDALLVTAFGIAGIPEGDPVTGSAIAAQMDKLVDPNGTFISFSGGTGFIDTAVNELSAGNTVDLKGVSGELDFDLETGDVLTDYYGWIPAPVGGDFASPTIAPQRVYIINPDATDGVWFGFTGEPCTDNVECLSMSCDMDLCL